MRTKFGPGTREKALTHWETKMRSQIRPWDDKESFDSLGKEDVGAKFGPGMIKKALTHWGRVGGRDAP